MGPNNLNSIMTNCGLVASKMKICVKYVGKVFKIKNNVYAHFLVFFSHFLGMRMCDLSLIIIKV